MHNTLNEKAFSSKCQPVIRNHSKCLRYKKGTELIKLNVFNSIRAILPKKTELMLEMEHPISSQN